MTNKDGHPGAASIELWTVTLTAPVVPSLSTHLLSLLRGVESLTTALHYCAFVITCAVASAGLCLSLTFALSCPPPAQVPLSL